MAVRPIDGNELVDTLKQIVSDYTSHGMYPSAFPVEYAIEIVEKMPTLTQPNEPLSTEQLREMDGEPVWFDTIKRWGIVKVNREGIFVVTKSGEYEFGRCKVYRRQPEGEEDT